MGVRVDAGIHVGSKINVYYDSMLAKLICHGQDRESARRLLLESLNGYHIEGLATNIDFAARVLSLPEFAAGDLHTGFIEQHFDGGRAKTPPRKTDLALTALAATLIYHARNAALQASTRRLASGIGTTLEETGQIRYTCKSGGDIFDIQLESEPVGGETCMIRVNEERFSVRVPFFEFFRRRLKLVINGQTHRFRCRFEAPPMVSMAFNGIAQVFEIYSPREWALMQFMPEKRDRAAGDALLCPMPGLVVDVPVQKGDRVFRGQSLVILESMKMESGVPSPIDGVVAEVLAKAGQAVEADDVLVRFEKG